MSYSHLSLNERYVIHHLSLYGLSNREIAHRLGRHHSTIDREVVRNGSSYASRAVGTLGFAQNPVFGICKWVAPLPFAAR
jgi:transposase, IS30 family